MTSRRHNLELDSSYLRTIPEDGDHDNTLQHSPAFQLPPVPSMSPQRALSNRSSTRGALNGSSESAPTEEGEGDGTATVVRTDGAVVGGTSEDPSWRGAGRSGAGANGRRQQGGRVHLTRIHLLTGWGDLSKKTRRSIAFSIVLTLLLLIAIILVVVFARTSAAESSLTNGNSSNNAPTLSPAPTPSPTISPSTRAHVDAVLYNISDASDLENPVTPQYKARQWMLEEDLLLNDVLADGDTRVAQRYACAELLYAMHLPNGTAYYYLDDNNNDDNVFHQNGSGADNTLADTVLVRDQSECEWHGFTCTSQLQGHVVTEIELAGLNLTGTLPSELSQLVYLQAFNLSMNLLWGTFPDSWFAQDALLHLYILDLGYNDLTGTIPSQIWSHFPVMSYLYLNHNDFRGGVDIIYPLTGPQNTTLTSPGTITNASTTTTATLINQLMSDIWLDNNALTGSFPSWMLKSYPSLQTLKLDVNNLTGPLPQDNDSSFYPNSSSNWPSTLRYLDLSSNQLTGAVPRSLFLAPSLTYMDLSYNSFSGHLPNSTSQFPSSYLTVTSNSSVSPLFMVKLHSNNFSGMFPPDFGSSWTNLTKLTLHNNWLTGTISADVCSHWTHLKNLSADCDLVQCACCTWCNYKISNNSL